MNLTSNSTARRRTANAAFRSFGGPQIPSPVRRIAPKPRRCTEISPPSETSPAKLAESSFLFMIVLLPQLLLFLREARPLGKSSSVENCEQLVEPAEESGASRSR